LRPLYQTDNDAKHEVKVVDAFHKQFVVWTVDDKSTGEDGKREKGHVLFDQTGKTVSYDFVMKKPLFVRLDSGGIIRVPDSEPLALVEVKKRKPRYGDYATYKLSKMKCDALINLSEKKNVPAFLVVGWQDRAGWMYINAPKSSPAYEKYWLSDDRAEKKSLKSLISSGEVSTEAWGRYDRNDPQDIELAYEWSNSNFVTFNY